jgi:hypothetical protein
LSSTKLRVRFYSSRTTGPRSTRWVTNSSVHGCTVSYRWSHSNGIVPVGVGKVCEEVFSSFQGIILNPLTVAVCQNTGYNP